MALIPTTHCIIGHQVVESLLARQLHLVQRLLIAALTVAVSLVGPVPVGKLVIILADQAAHVLVLLVKLGMAVNV